RRGLAPGRGDLDAVLLEDRLSPLVVDDGGAQLPGQLVVRMPSRLREEPSKAQARATFGWGRPGLSSRVLQRVGRHRGDLRYQCLSLSDDASPAARSPGGLGSAASLLFTTNRRA